MTDLIWVGNTIVPLWVALLFAGGVILFVVGIAAAVMAFIVFVVSTIVNWLVRLYANRSPD